MYYIIYETENLVNGRCYRGAHSTSDLNDDYLGSGKLLKQAIDKYGKEKFTRTILFTAFSSEGMFEIEKVFVDEDWVNDKSTYNLKIGGEGGFDHIDNKGRTLSEETKRKMSEAKKGENHPMWGKPHSDESKRKLSEAGKNRTHSEETKRKMSETRKGKYVGENNPFYGKPHSEKSRKKISEAHKGKPKQKITCPHCNKIGGISIMKRWHFDNCKHKTR